MSKWECIVCGLVYDEAKGWPDDGIAPGTKWEDVPEDWLCPDCGVGKEDFELIEESEVEQVPHHQEAEADTEHAPVVIIGTGLAGYGLAKEFRKHDDSTPLILITADDGRAYSKPMLSTGYTKDTSADDLATADAGSMGQTLNASVWTRTRVAGIDTEKQLVHVADSETALHYSKLVLAVGADVIKPPLAGDALAYVYSVNDLLDYDDFRQAIAKNNVKKVCIIGGGLIGCEFTNDLLNGGFEVEAVDPLAYCLPTLLPEAAGKAVQIAPLMAAARALGKTLAGDATEVAYPAMPVTIKTPACPVVVSPVAPDAAGEWQVSEDGNNVKAEFRDSAGQLLGFALTGDATKEKLSLQKQLPAILP